MTDGWEPLPADVAEWMGMDETMVPFAVELGGDPAPVEPDPTDSTPAETPAIVTHDEPASH